MASPIDILGTEKQGLGYRLISDGQVWPMKINDPGSIAFPRNSLSTTHSGTTKYKQEKPEELAEQITQDITCFFDPQNLAGGIGWDINTDGARTKRAVYIMFPLTDQAGSATPDEHAFFYYPEGYITGNGISMPLDNFMVQDVQVKQGTADPTTVPQGAAAATPTVITLSDTTGTGTIPAGTTVATLSTDVAPTAGVALYGDLGGADAALFELIGNKLVTKSPISSSTGTAGVHTLDITVGNLVGWEQDIAAYKYTETGLTFTVS